MKLLLIVPLIILGTLINFLLRYYGLDALSYLTGYIFGTAVTFIISIDYVS